MKRIFMFFAIGVLLLAFGTADAKPLNSSGSKIQQQMKPGQAPDVPDIHATECNKAREDLDRQAANLPSITRDIVECLNDGRNLEYCGHRLNTFNHHYEYMKEASIRKNRYCKE